MVCKVILKVLSPELICVNGSKHIVADALSRLDKRVNINNFNNYSNNKVESASNSVSENFASNNEDSLHPTSFKSIMTFQLKNKSQIENAKEKPEDYFIKQFYGAVKICIFLFVERK